MEKWKTKTSKCRKFEMKKTMKAIENITNGKLQIKTNVYASIYHHKRRKKHGKETVVKQWRKQINERHAKSEVMRKNKTGNIEEKREYEKKWREKCREWGKVMPSIKKKELN